MLPMLWNETSHANRIFSPSFLPSLFDGAPCAECAPLDVTERADGYEVAVDVPGLAKGDLKIGLEDSVLTISGERKAPVLPEGTFARSERWSGPFERTIKLSNAVDSTKITASLKDGVLTLLVPKAESAKPREIAIG